MHRFLQLFGYFFIFSTYLSLAEALPAEEILSQPLLQQKEVATIYPSNTQYVILRGIAISGKKEARSIDAFSGVHFDQLQIPGGEGKLSILLTTHLGKPITDDLIKTIKSDIVKYYQAERHPLVMVLVPEQDASLGVLQVSVIEGRVGKVIVKGTKWTGEGVIRKEIRFRPNEPIDEHLLEQDIYWLNRQPFRQAYVVYSPGEKEGTTDMQVVVKDRMPFRGYVGTDNIGNDITGNLRLFAGLNIGNIFGNQFFSYQFTTDRECKKFMAHSVYYKAPLPWRHELVLLGGYSSVDAKYRVGSNSFLFHSKGFSTQASLRYDIPLHPWRNVLSECTFGLDFKRTNNALAYGVKSLWPNGHLANLTQMMAGYNIGYTKKITISFEIEGYWSPGRWISDQTKAQYDSIRYGSNCHYAYLRSAFTLVYPFYKEWTWKHYIRWQLSNRNLLPSEEYGLGGFDTIRGYKEREVNVDHAIVYNMEFHAPAFSFFKKKSVNDRLDLFVFGDIGYGVKNVNAPKEKKDYFLASCGPGARYNITPYLAVRAEWGVQLKDLVGPGFGGPYQRLHFSLIAGF
jgi:hemolysin activation/secretion protein